MAMAIPTGVMAMLPFIMLLLQYTMLQLTMHQLLFIMPRAAIGRRNRSGYQVARDTGLISITTRAVMYGCWDIGRKDQVVPDTGRSSRSGLYNNKA